MIFILLYKLLLIIYSYLIKWKNSILNFFKNYRVLEEVIIKRKKDQINKEKLSEKVKNELLNKKKKRQEKESYLTAQKIVKNYREKQKSHSAFKRKLYSNEKNMLNNFEESRQGSPVIVVRISGYIKLFNFL